MSFAYISMALKLIFLNIQHIYGEDPCYRVLFLVASTHKQTSNTEKEINKETSSIIKKKHQEKSSIKKEINRETSSIK